MEITDKEFESIKSKILKLKALAERGEKGEAINAQRLLDKILRKYGITLEDVIDKSDERKWYSFKCWKKHEKTVLFQCYYKVLNVNECSYKERSGNIYFHLTAYEYAELFNLYQWHKVQINKEIKRVVEEFTEAYIFKHGIISGKESENDDSPLTKEDLERISRVMKLMNNVEDTSYCKMIESK